MTASLGPRTGGILVEDITGSTAIDMDQSGFWAYGGRYSVTIHTDRELWYRFSDDPLDGIDPDATTGASRCAYMPIGTHTMVPSRRWLIVTTGGSGGGGGGIGSLPSLVSPGASYAAAWRAEDAVLSGSDIVSIPSHLGHLDADLVPRQWNDGTQTWSEGAAAGVTYSATGIGGEPAIIATGIQGLYCSTRDPLLRMVEGAGKKAEVFIRHRASYNQAFGNICGWEAWDENQSVNLEVGSSALTQVDRGQYRSQSGSQTFSSDPQSLRMRVDSDAQIQSFIALATSPDASLSWSSPIGSGDISAFALGPLQRSAGNQFPPGVWTWGSYEGRVGRVVIVSGHVTDATDRENLIDWVEGTDFDVGGGGAAPTARVRIWRSSQ